jgi:choline dehydrogenase-like flavoprotein
MLVQGDLLPFGTTLRADVAVVGSGPAGITCAEQLASSGVRVLLLEAAGRTHSGSDDDALDGEGSGVPFPLVRSRHRGFGGTSTHWTPATGLRVRPYDRVDFIARAGRPVEAWPFSADALEPYYRRATEMLGLGSGFGPERWYGPSSPTPLAWPGGPQLAMFQFAPHDCFVSRFDQVTANRRIDLVLNGTVDRLELSAGGSTVEQVTVVCRGGNRFIVVAPVVVLACGAIENARLLLRSPGRDGRGVGNEHDNVGRYFMDHLSVDTGRLVPTAGQPVDPQVFREHTTEGGRYQPMLWLGDDIVERAELPNAAFWIDELDPLYLSAGVSAARSLRGALHGRPRRLRADDAARLLRHSPDVLRFGARKVRRRAPTERVLSMRILIEQTPDRDSRVTLAESRDDLGMARVDLDWRVATDDLDAIRAHQDLLARHLEQRGVGTIVDRFEREDHASPIMSNYHHLGTTRMHADPRHGVVDGLGRVHTTDNLYVLGGSTFPSGGYLNPTLTILALALRTADAISAARRPVTVRDTAS